MANSLEFWKQIDSEKLSSDLSRLCTSVLHSTVTLEMDPQQVVPGQDEPVVSAKGRLDQEVSTNENKELEVSTNDNKELEVPANENKEMGVSTNDNIELEVPANQRRGVAPPDFVTIACMKCLSCLPGGIPGLFDVLMDTVKGTLRFWIFLSNISGTENTFNLKPFDVFNNNFFLYYSTLTVLHHDYISCKQCLINI